MLCLVSFPLTLKHSGPCGVGLFAPGGGTEWKEARGGPVAGCAHLHARSVRVGDCEGPGQADSGSGPEAVCQGSPTGQVCLGLQDHPLCSASGRGGGGHHGAPPPRLCAMSWGSQRVLGCLSAARVCSGDGRPAWLTSGVSPTSSVCLCEGPLALIAGERTEDWFWICPRHSSDLGPSLRKGLVL